jgi:hypothetical protein
MRKALAKSGHCDVAMPCPLIPQKPTFAAMSLSQFFHRSRHFCSIMISMLGYEDFSVVVKNRAKPPKPWRWEIYRAGRTSPIEYSQNYFETIGEANRAGKKALQLLLSEYPPSVIPNRKRRHIDFKKGASNISSTAAGPAALAVCAALGLFAACVQRL